VSDHGITADELAVVTRASDGPQDLTTVRIDSLYGQGVASATAGIWRCSTEGWSVVLKLLRHGDQGSPAWRSGEAPDHWYYWRREADAFTSGALDRLTPPLRSPRCYGALERPDGSLALWMEDLSGLRPAVDWDIARYRRAALDLGRAQGALSAAPLMGSWLARDWLRQYVIRHQDALAHLEDPDIWAHPLVRELLPRETPAECRAIWDAREDLLGLLDSLPPTLTHSDLHPGNLFGDDETVAIDWSFAGRGPIGEDPGNLVFDAVWDHFVDPGLFPELQAAVHAGYVAGLAESGGALDPDQAARAIAAAGAVKFFWIPPTMAAAAAAGAQNLNRRPLEETFRRWAVVVPEVFEARRRALGP